MSNKRALIKYEDYDNEIAKCDYVISKTKNPKCKRDFIKRKQTLIKEKKIFEMYHRKS